jgi:hypothetical protein
MQSAAQILNVWARCSILLRPVDAWMASLPSMATKQNALVLRLHVDWLCMEVCECATAAVGDVNAVATITIMDIMIINFINIKTIKIIALSSLLSSV